MSDLLQFAIDKVDKGEDLTLAESSQAIDAMMVGEALETQIATLLLSLAEKGETADEIAGAAMSLRQHMTPIRTSRTGLVDTCGTGGGGSQTFNISTTAAIVTAAAGVPVAKHGNRSITSRSGSADVLAAMGVNIEASVAQVERCLNELGLCFCFAPLQHPSMKHVANVRRSLGRRTIFNILGPLANPAGAEYQLLGAGIPHLRPLLAEAAQKLGTTRTLVVSGADGLGDVTIAGKTSVSDVSGGAIGEFSWSPADFGIREQSTESLTIETPAESASLIHSILAGEVGPARDIVVMNAAAALLVAGAVGLPSEGVAQAAAAIDSGAATRLLAKLVELSHAR